MRFQKLALGGFHPVADECACAGAETANEGDEEDGFPWKMVRAGRCIRSLCLESFGRHTDNRLPIQDITHHHRASGDEGACADADALDDHGPCSDVSGLADADIPAQHGTSGDVAMRADDAVMLDDGGGIHEHMLAELGIRVDDGSGQDLAASATHGGGRDVGGGMDDALCFQSRLDCCLE